MIQFVTRLDDDLAAAVDELVAEGVVANRSEAVRAGLLDFVDQHRRRSVGETIAAGYQRVPQDPDEWDDAATVAMIAEEPW